jgi:hypothetical protein
MRVHFYRFCQLVGWTSAMMMMFAGMGSLAFVGTAADVLR